MNIDEKGLLEEITQNPLEASLKLILADYYYDNGQADLSHSIRWLAHWGKWPITKDEICLYEPWRRVCEGKFYWRARARWKKSPHWVLPVDLDICRMHGWRNIKSAIKRFSSELNHYRHLTEVPIDDGVAKTSSGRSGKPL